MRQYGGGPSACEHLGFKSAKVLHLGPPRGYSLKTQDCPLVKHRSQLRPWPSRASAPVHRSLRLRQASHEARMGVAMEGFMASSLSEDIVGGRELTRVVLW